MFKYQRIGLSYFDWSVKNRKVLTSEIIALILQWNLWDPIDTKFEKERIIVYRLKRLIYEAMYTKMQRRLETDVWGFGRSDDTWSNDW